MSIESDIFAIQAEARKERAAQSAQPLTPEEVVLSEHKKMTIDEPPNARQFDPLR